jgi:hypothetical protein
MVVLSSVVLSESNGEEIIFDIGPVGRRDVLAFERLLHGLPVGSQDFFLGEAGSARGGQGAHVDAVALALTG